MDPKASDPGLNRTLKRAADGDANAWRVLVEAYSRRVFGLLVKQCGDRELAEEITQATFVRVVSHIGRYREQGKFEPWLFRIAMNNLRDEMRRRKRHAKPMDMTGGRDDEGGAWSAAESQVVHSGSPEASSPFEHASRAEQVDQVKQAVARLSPADQEILYLRHTAGLSFAQIAEALEEPLGTVLARGHRALSKLRRLMGATGGESPGPPESGESTGKDR